MLVKRKKKAFAIALYFVLYVATAQVFAQVPLCQTGKVLVAPKGQRGAQISEFVTTKNTPAKAKTSAVVKWDDNGLTVIFECDDTEIVAEKRPRDDAEMWKNDCVEVFLDPGHTHSHKNKWLHVLVSAAGSIYDEQGPVCEFYGSGDVKRAVVEYDAEALKAKVKKTPKGWYAEIMIPWADIGVRPKPGDVWGINLNREEHPVTEYLCWSPTFYGFNRIHQWGEIIFVSEDEKDVEDALVSIQRKHEEILVCLRRGLDPTFAWIVKPKTRGNTIIKKEWIKKARDNASNAKWGKEIARRILETADYWAQKKDKELLELVPTGNPRALTPGQYYGDPISGGNRFALYTCLETPYRWYNPKTKMWWYDGAVVTNPATGEEVVVHDDGSGFLQPEGFAHPGVRTYFVAAYRGYLIGVLTHWPYHQGAGPDIIPGSSGRRYYGAIPRLAEAYALTGEREYARKAAILLGRLAELYPYMNGGMDDEAKISANNAAAWLERSTTDYRYLLKFLDGMDLIWDAIDKNMEKQLAKLFDSVPGPDGKKRTKPFNLKQSLNEMMPYAAQLCEKYRRDTTADWSLSWINTEIALAACTESPQLIADVLFGPSPALETLLMNAYYRDGRHIYDSFAYLTITPRHFLTIPLRTVGFQDGDIFTKPLNLYNDDRFPIDEIISFLEKSETGALRPTFGDGDSGRNPRPVPEERLLGLPRYYPDMEVAAAFSVKGKELLKAHFRDRSVEEIDNLRTNGDFLTMAFAESAKDLVQKSSATSMQSTLLEDSSVSFLRCGQSPRTRHDLVLWGVPTGAHAHANKLGIWFGGRGRNLAAAGGGYPFTGVDLKVWAWETHSAPCWVVLVDGKRQEKSYSDLLAYHNGDLFRLCAMENSTAYPGCRQRRTVWLIPGPRDGDAYALDIFEVSGGGKVFDYNTRGNDAGRFEDISFEFQGEAPEWTKHPGTLAGLSASRLSGQAGENVELYSKPGYGWMKDVRMTARDKDFSWMYDYGGAALKVNALSFGRKRKLIYALGEVGGFEMRKSPWDPHVLWRDEAADPKTHETQFVTILESVGKKPFLSKVEAMACSKGARGIHPVGITIKHVGGHTDVILMNPSPGHRVSFTDAKGKTWSTDAFAVMQRIDPEGKVIGTEIFDGTILKTPYKKYRCHRALEGKVEAVDYAARKITVRLDRRTGADADDVEGHIGILFPTAGGRLTAYRVQLPRLSGSRLMFTSPISLIHVYAKSHTAKEAAIESRPIRIVGGKEVVVDIVEGDRFRLPLSSSYQSPL